MVEGALGSAQEALVELLAHERGRERQVAAGQSLAAAEDVRRDALALGRPERAGAAQADRHLVADQQAARLRRTAARARASQPSGATRMPAAAWISGSTISAKTSSPCSASSSARPSASGSSMGLGACSAGPSSGAKAAWNASMPPGRDGAERVAVVAVAQPYDARSPRLTAQLGVAQRELDRHLAGTRAALREEGAREAGRSRLQQRIGERHRRRIREAEERRVGDAVELLADGGVDLRPAMAVHVDPQRRVAVEVAPCRSRRSATSPRRRRSRADPRAPTRPAA